MLVAAAVCPHPPLLVPEVAAGAAGELDGLRAVCDEAVRRVVARRPEIVVVVGSAERTGRREATETGSLRGFGIDVVPGAAVPGAAVLKAALPAGARLPLSLTMGTWLLDRVGWAGATLRFGVHRDAPAAQCLKIGRDLAASAAQVGLLAMGDGSARRSDKAPGALDPRAAGHDAAVAAALASGDVRALESLDPALSADLLAAGRAPWQVLAGAAADGLRGGAAVRSVLLYDDAPYGVGYLVAAWD